MKSPTYEEVANDFDLWMTYVDPGATMTEEEFDAMTVEERIAMEVEIFGPEEAEEEDEEEDEEEAELSLDDVPDEWL